MSRVIFGTLDLPTHLDNPSIQLTTTIILLYYLHSTWYGTHLTLGVAS